MSFFVMLNIYDDTELKMNNVEAYKVRDDALNFHPQIFQHMVIENIPKDFLEQAGRDVFNAYGDYSFLLSAGRSNYFLTPQRQQLNQSLINLYDVLGEELYNDFAAAPPIEYLHLQKERYDSLMHYLIADDFNHYTVSAANSFSKIFEGNFLLMIMIFSLLLFHDLFAKDFDTKTYRHLYTTTHSRSKIIISKLLFALIYMTLLIGIATILLIGFLFITKRHEYETIASRVGDLRHLKIVNTNWRSTFNKTIILGLMSHAALNVMSAAVGMSFIMLWMIIVIFLSFKLKSANNTLVIGTYGIIAFFAINLTSLRDGFTFIFPLFGYQYSNFIYGDSIIHVTYVFILNILFSIMLLFIFLRNANTIDLLDGDHND